ncbi:hypothetical protein HS088_TW21G00485 [Tripterygium wilfordii]|uniref:Wound-responsive family protein n=1 Tax=Tripterygium wilfordii TaxID=458696 RepID=A0A7J7C2K3_TRIWF|nr:uncharacterized protein LOC119989567 [Tripterygium wilfordii]KAF5728338.1 hypothetical protein HS088_TW21G00485 [Tripterygium wilfordii]
MSSARKAWVVAASIGAVEALKDQGICRWNYPIRSLHQHVKNNIRSFAQAKILSPPTSTIVANNEMRSCNKVKKSAEVHGKVVQLSCWGPSTVRF